MRSWPICPGIWVKTFRWKSYSSSENFASNYTTHDGLKFEAKAQVKEDENWIAGKAVSRNAAKSNKKKKETR